MGSCLARLLQGSFEKESSSIYNLLQDKSSWNEDFEPLLHEDSDDLFIANCQRDVSDLTKPEDKSFSSVENEPGSPVFEMYEAEAPKLSQPCCDCQCNEPCHVTPDTDSPINGDWKWKQLTEINLDPNAVPKGPSSGGGDDFASTQNSFNYSSRPISSQGFVQDLVADEAKPHANDLSISNMQQLICL